MRDHELELIAALVEGRLEDETEARALIASSTEAREEYEAQMLAYDAMQTMGTARLDDDERAALHRDVWTQLRSPVPIGHTRTPWYYRWVPVAAALFLVVGLVAVLSDGGQETARLFSDISSGLGGGAAAAETTTTAAAAEAPAADEEDGASQESDRDTAESLAEGTTEAQDASFYEAEAARVRRGAFTGSLQQYEESSGFDVEACLEEADLINYRPVATLIHPYEPSQDPETTLVVAAPEKSDLAEAPVAFVDTSTCELVYLDESPD